MTYYLAGPRHDLLSLDEELRAYDWQILIKDRDRFRMGAIGRTKTKTRSRERVVEALKALPEGTKAHGEVLIINVHDPDRLRLIEVAARKQDDLVAWIRI